MRDKASKKEIRKRDFTSFSLNEFKQDLLFTDLDNKLSKMDDPSLMYDYFHSTLSLLFEIHCPIKKLNRSEKKQLQKPWITKSILEKTLVKEQLYDEYLRTGDTDIHKEYKITSCSINKDIRNSKYHYHRKKFQAIKSNAKKMWKEANVLLGRSNSKSLPQLMYRENKKLNSRKEIVNNFNDHYSKVAPNLLKNMKKGGNPLRYLESSDKSMFFAPVTPSEVSDYIKELNPAKAIDLFKFPTKIIKDIRHLICTPLSMIINKSVKKGIFPEKLKIAKVAPVFKSGNKLDIKNYRPISVLPLFDKIFEKAINSRLTHFLDINNVLCENQFGFQKGKSTADAVLKLSDEIYKSTRKKETCCTILLDLAKAFDTVDHSILLNKLSAIGVRGPLHTWFKSYLTDRKQVVSVDSEISDPILMKYGVPQGSVLGPTLFLIYINDITKSTSKFKFTLFADDTCLFMKHSDPKILEEMVNNELEHINNWLISNRLSLNIKKSCYLLFSGKKTIDNFIVRIAGTEMEKVSKAKYLGILVDDKLSW